MTGLDTLLLLLLLLLEKSLKVSQPAIHSCLASDQLPPTPPPPPSPSSPPSVFFSPSVRRRCRRHAEEEH